MRLSSNGIPLRGYRVGTYEFPSKSKGSNGDYNFKILVKTDLFFMDEDGKDTADEMKATQEAEVLEEVSIYPIEEPVRNGSFIQKVIREFRS